jgi:hypothetical protein
MQRTIYINSANRDIGGNDADFTVTRNVVEFSGVPKSAKLMSVSIPYTWNNITNTNNTFSITETAVGTDNFVISVGNYDGTALATEVQSLLNASGVLTHNYTVVFDSSTLKFTITNSVNTIQITFAPTGSAALLLGFAPGSSSIVALSIVSTETAGLLPDYEIFVCSSLVAGSDNGVMLWSPTYTPSIVNQSQILARVPITSCYSGVINYCTPAGLPAYVISQSSFARAVSLGEPATIRFFLALPSGLSIDLNGYHWSGEIVLTF